MGRQVSLLTHCLVCLREAEAKKWHGGNAKNVYERNGTQGFTPVAMICDSCLAYLRGRNWPTEVYAKLAEGREPEGKRAVEALVAA